MDGRRGSEGEMEEEHMAELNAWAFSLKRKLLIRPSSGFMTTAVKRRLSIPHTGREYDADEGILN